MREFQHRRSKREELLRLGLRTMGALLLLVLTITLARGAWCMYIRMAAASQGAEEADVELTRLEAQAQGASSTLAELSTARGQEAQIRQRFGVVKPGEGEIDILQVEPHSSSTEPAEPWWQRIFHALFVW